MKQSVPWPVAAVIVAIVVVLIGFFGYRALVPQKVLLAPGTPIPPMPQPRGGTTSGGGTITVPPPTGGANTGAHGG